MKEIRFSDHGKFKIDMIANHGLNISPEFIIDTICNPDKIEILPEPKIIFQRRLNENLVLRVISREFSAFILIITYTLERQVDMKKIKYSKDVDTLLIELSDKPISYAEEDGQVILHYSDDDMLVLIEVLDFRQFISEDTTAELVSIS
jgi:hypothetical protein